MLRIRGGRLLLPAILTVCFAFQSALADKTCAGQLCIQTIEDPSGVHFSAINAGPGTVTVSIEASLTNLAADFNFPHTAAVKPGFAHLFSLRTIRRDQRHKSHYEFRFRLGDWRAKTDGTVYSLPFSPGEEYPILQGSNSAYSHNGSLAWSMDWDMPEGTEVRAARGGIVVSTESRNTIGAPDRRLFTKANHILIQHADGTIGEYYHLKPGGVAVRIGQVVSEGDLIGYSGNTGFSTQPHLHFHVSRPVDGKEIQSLRIYYRTDGSNAQTLWTGKWYRSVPAPLTEQKRLDSLPEILLCASVQKGEPVDQRSRFHSGERVFTFFRFPRGASQALRVQFKRNGETLHEGRVLTHTSGEYAFIALDPRRIQEPSGKWEAAVFVNGTLASTLAFEIE